MKLSTLNWLINVLGEDCGMRLHKIISFSYEVALPGLFSTGFIRYSCLVGGLRARSNRLSGKSWIISADREGDPNLCLKPEQGRCGRIGRKLSSGTAFCGRWGSVWWRNEKAGSAFNGGDLNGILFRIILSPKNIKENRVEFETCEGFEKEMLPIDTTVATIIDKIQEERAKQQ